MITLGKILQAIGIAETMIGLVAGLQGSMAREMTFAGIGILVFIIGRLIEKAGARKNRNPSQSDPMSS
ncbi:MAG: hypothetical protein ACK44H_02365 [Candidatus Kryptonium sp.]